MKMQTWSPQLYSVLIMLLISNTTLQWLITTLSNTTCICKQNILTTQYLLMSGMSTIYSIVLSLSVIPNKKHVVCYLVYSCYNSSFFAIREIFNWIGRSLAVIKWTIWKKRCQFNDDRNILKFNFWRHIRWVKFK